MIGIELPQDREYRLAAQEELPGRLDHGEPRARDVLPELVAHHPLPRVELEERANRRAVEIDEGIRIAGPADVLDVDVPRIEPRLKRRVAQILEVAEIFLALLDAREVNDRDGAGQRRADRAPAGDELLVERVELVGVRPDRLEPAPLRDRRLDE
jgi:hypothetical protein